jgi:hypothetical protein
MERAIIKQQQSNRPAGTRHEDGLYRSSGELKERVAMWDMCQRQVFTTQASLHPLLTESALVGARLAMAAFLRAKRSGAR